jgi:ribosomal protein S18 acetylase RimI-like enzyme
MQLREFRMDDYPEVIALWRTAGLAISLSDSQEGLRRKLERDSDLFLVAQEKDSIVGAIMGCFDGRRGWLNHLAVAPAQQGTGLGSLLVKQVEERLKAKGCHKVNLLIEPANKNVQSFYEKLDYACDDLIFMEKWLS